MKSGISSADIMGGELALLTIVAALAYRDRSGVGQAIDISMQDAGVWATQMEWGSSAASPRTAIMHCADGYLAVDGPEGSLNVWLTGHGLNTEGSTTTLTCNELSSLAESAGLVAATVNSVNEVLQHPQVEFRDLVLYTLAGDGLRWPLLNSPLRLSRTPPVVRRPIGALGEANQDIFGRPDAESKKRDPAAAK
jgi:crotonobetainyl-CoA:carnitine CoA-transferase CaiB-like acyl-CoA transferase